MKRNYKRSSGTDQTTDASATPAILRYTHISTGSIITGYEFLRTLIFNYNSSSMIVWP